MELGFLPAERRGNLRPLFWVEGEPSFWPLGLLRLRDRRRLTVEAWRCTSCGRLDLRTGEPAR